MIYPTFDKEREFFKATTVNGALIAGIDEAGRGPLAGPVVIGIVVIKDESQFIPEVRDSKTLSEAQRERLFEKITQTVSDWGFALRDNVFIDTKGIVPAVRESIVEAFYGCKLKPAKALIDGKHLKDFPFEYSSFDKADRDIYCVAAASIIAKVIRDRMVTQFEKEFPMYKFSQHKGYGTSLHMAEIRANGLCPVHRKSFCGNLV